MTIRGLNILAGVTTIAMLLLLYLGIIAVCPAGSFLGVSSDTELIKDYVHFRLLSPDWFGSRGDSLFFAWWEAEITLRLCLAVIVWGVAMLIINRRIRNKMKSNQAFHAPSKAAQGAASSAHED